MEAASQEGPEGLNRLRRQVLEARPDRQAEAHRVGQSKESPFEIPQSIRCPVNDLREIEEKVDRNLGEKREEGLDEKDEKERDINW